MSSGSNAWVYGGPGFSPWPAVPVPEWSTNDQAKVHGGSEGSTGAGGHR